MNRIEYYMNLPYKLVIIPDPDEGGYVARYPDLPGCITVGSSLEDELNNAEEAKREWLRVALESGTTITEPVTADRYSG
jgi:predicted RNase H-like HicB family nuclease